MDAEDNEWMNAPMGERPHLEDTVLQTDMGRVAAFHIAKMGKVAEPGVALLVMEEELNELLDAVTFSAGCCETGDCDCGASADQDILKEMCDAYYTILGYALSRGWDFVGAFDAVHKSNMTKALTKNGKVIKGPWYVAPDLSKFVAG